MRRCSTRFRLLSSLALACAVALGCVSRSTFETTDEERARLERERDDLAKKLELVETSVESFQKERVALIDEAEELRQTNAEQATAIARLRASHAEIAEDLEARDLVLAQREEELARLNGTYTGLVADLEAEVAAGQIRIEQLREGLHLNLSQEILFRSGSANINATGLGVLKTVAARLQSLPNRIEVRGHTDDVAIGPSAGFPSNWELAAARAATVVRLFEENGVDPERMTVISFGQYAPVASNDTPEGRAQNRRIEIRLKPEASAESLGVGAPPET